MRILRAIAAFIGLYAATAIAGSVQQSGNVTPKHGVMWTTSGVVQDAGPATNGLFSELGITKQGGCAFGINSGPITGGYNQLCLGVSSTQAYLSLQNFGSQAQVPFNFIFNGTTYPFPGPGNGNVVGPSPAAPAGHVALWNSGLTLKDGGQAIVVSASAFGAVGDCTTDDATPLRNAVAAAVALASQFSTAATTGGNKVAVDLGGACLALGSTVTLGPANGLVLQNGKIVPANSFTGTLIFNNGSFNTIQGIYCDGRKTADCFDASTFATTFAFHLANNQWAHTPNFGAKVTMSGGVIEGNIGTQWYSSDPEYLIQADLTAKALWVLDADGLVTNNIMHNALYPLECGDGAGRICQTILFTGNHFYNGINSSPGFADAIAIHIPDMTSGELMFTNTYLDNSKFQSKSPSVSFSGNLILNDQSQNTLTAWFQFIPSTNAQGMGSFHFYGPVTTGGSGVATALFDLGVVCPNGGGACWSAPVAYFAANSTPGDFQISNAAKTIVSLGAAVGFSEHLATNFTNNCLGLTATFSGAAESTVCVSGGFNNLVLSANGLTGLVIGPDGTVRFPAAAVALTCSGGNCGSGATVSGSNNVGHVVLGTSPVSQITINFSPAWTTSPGSPVNPTCVVQEKNALADVTAYNPTSATLTVTMTSPTATNTISWICSINVSQ